MKGPRVTIPALHAQVPGSIMEAPRTGEGAVTWRGRLAWAAIWYSRFKNGERSPGQEKIATYAGMDRETFRSGVAELEYTSPPRLRVGDRGKGRAPDYDLLDEQGRSIFEVDGRRIAAKKEAPVVDDPEEVALASAVKAFTDAWVREYPEAHATIGPGEVKQTAPYSFAGSKDRGAAERIVKTCRACSPPVDPMDVARMVWSSPKYRKGKGFLGAMGKSIAVLSSGMNEALSDLKSGAGKHGPASDYAGRASNG